MALSIDAIQLFGHALRDMARKMIMPNTEKILCDAGKFSTQDISVQDIFLGDVWQDGELFNGALRTVSLFNKQNIHSILYLFRPVHQHKTQVLWVWQKDRGMRWPEQTPL